MKQTEEEMERARAEVYWKSGWSHRSTRASRGVERGVYKSSRRRRASAVRVRALHGEAQDGLPRGGGVRHPDRAHRVHHEAQDVQTKIILDRRGRVPGRGLYFVCGRDKRGDTQDERMRRRDVGQREEVALHLALPAEDRPLGHAAHHVDAEEGRT